MLYNKNVKESLMAAFEGYRSGDVPLYNSRKHTFSIPTPNSSIQPTIRPLFGKEGINPPDIGDHPDFLEIKDSDRKIYCPITTLFMDIESSTRMGLIFPLEDVHKIKNAFILATIEIAQAFDGHVHRIMGDAVMVYFGGTNDFPEDTVANALNAASLIRYFTEEVVIPSLNSDGLESNFGIRIGIDHGKKEDVLWASYGYHGTSEVTATSFYVDVASKLQHSAGKNQIMIGQSLREFVDLPEELLEIKTMQSNGEQKEDLYIKPNHTDRNGNPINYQKYLWRWDKYLKYTPLPKQIHNNNTVYLESQGAIRGNIHCYEENNTPYAATSRMLEKHRDIVFKLVFAITPRFPYTLTFAVENHGKEAEKAHKNDNHEITKTIHNIHAHRNITHTETTLYRGLHYMTVTASFQNGQQFKDTFGVYIK